MGPDRQPGRGHGLRLASRDDGDVVLVAAPPGSAHQMGSKTLAALSRIGGTEREATSVLPWILGGRKGDPARAARLSVRRGRADSARWARDGGAAGPGRRWADLLDRLPHRGGGGGGGKPPSPPLATALQSKSHKKRIRCFFTQDNHY